jgi:hypothetical protein
VDENFSKTIKSGSISMDSQPPFLQVLNEECFSAHWMQLVEDRVYLRKLSADRAAVLFCAPVYSDTGVLAEARKVFPDFSPLGGIPVDPS